MGQKNNAITIRCFQEDEVQSEQNIVNSRRLIFCVFASIFLIQSCSHLVKKDEPKAVESEPVVVESVEPEIEAVIEVPDFSAFRNIKLKKITFFNFIYDFVETVNMEVKTRRLKIIAIAQKTPIEITDEDQLFIEKMSSLYLNEHDPSDTINTALILLNHVDIVPPSLALAQAANESGWGTSRFATDANNYFGQWCFKQGCGLVPEQRSSGSNFEVRKFNTVEDSVRSYIRNINTHRAYAELRKIRTETRQNGDFPSGEILSDGLRHYSQRGELYIDELQSIIQFNDLENYDEMFLKFLNEKNALEIEEISL